MLESFEADQAAGEVEQRFVGLGVAFVADVESVVLVEPGEGALDDPSPGAETGSVLCLSACDQWRNAERAYLSAVELVVVATVGDQVARASLGRPASSAHRRDRLQQQQQLRAVVAVGAGECPGKRQTAAVC